MIIRTHRSTKLVTQHRTPNHNTLELFGNGTTLTRKTLPGLDILAIAFIVPLFYIEKMKTLVFGLKERGNTKGTLSQAETGHI